MANISNPLDSYSITNFRSSVDTVLANRDDPSNTFVTADERRFRWSAPRSVLNTKIRVTYSRVLELDETLVCFEVFGLSNGPIRTDGVVLANLFEDSCSLSLRDRGALGRRHRCAGL